MWRLVRRNHFRSHQWFSFYFPLTLLIRRRADATHSTSWQVSNDHHVKCILRLVTNYLSIFRMSRLRIVHFVRLCRYGAVQRPRCEIIVISFRCSYKFQFPNGPKSFTSLVDILNCYCIVWCALFYSLIRPIIYTTKFQRHFPLAVKSILMHFITGLGSLKAKSNAFAINAFWCGQWRSLNKTG